MNSAGADTALNFNKGSNVNRGSIAIGNTWSTVNIGFRPKFVLVTTLGIASNLNVTLIYDNESISDKYRYIAKGSSGNTSFTTKTLGTELDISDTGFTIKVNSGYAISNALMIAY